MLLTAISCPQCGGALPKAARWMVVTCAHCGAKVSANKQVVRRSAYSDARARLWADAAARDALHGGAQYVKLGERQVRLLARLARGEHSDVFLGCRVGPFAERYTVRVAHDGNEPRAERYFAGALHALRALHAATHVATAPFFTLRTPQVVAQGTDHALHGAGRAVLLLRHPPDYWGSLAQVLACNPGGIDARHVVWMWSRCLDLLGYAHACGWTHDALTLEHLLVQPHDHSMMLVGWGRASASARHAAQRARDHAQLAWSMRQLLSPPPAHDNDTPPSLREDVPAPLAQLLRRAAQDEAWLCGVDAQQLRELLMQVAQASFGPRKFVPFNPRAAAPAAGGHPR